MKIFVYGYYGKGNLGDETFKDSFLELFPSVEFTFDSEIPLDINSSYDAFWVGGGSFLDQKIIRINEVTIPIAFIGVGIGKAIHPDNAKALEHAKIIVVRDSDSYDACWQFKTPLFQAADLVFARSDLQPFNQVKTKRKQILVLLNDCVTPWGRHVPEWQSLAHSWFIQEFSKTLDRLVEREGCFITFQPMCINPRTDDRRMAAKIIGHSERPHAYNWGILPVSELFLRQEISQSACVITQRFHGLIFSLIEGTPVIPICLHDKFKGLCKDLCLPYLDYYGLTDVEFDAIYHNVDSPNLFGSYLIETRNAWQKAVYEIKRLFGIDL